VREADLSCREIVELVSEYLEDALPGPRRRRFEEHMRRCPDCATYLAQMRGTIEVLGELREESLTPTQHERLLAAFRGWRHA
jgi:anti-sigma factor RsiW